MLNISGIIGKFIKNSSQRDIDKLKSIVEKINGWELKIKDVCVVLLVLFVYIKSKWVESKEIGTDKMKRIATNISDGAMAFLKAEYKILTIFVILTSVILAYKGYS